MAAGSTTCVKDNSKKCKTSGQANHSIVSGKGRLCRKTGLLVFIGGG